MIPSLLPMVQNHHTFFNQALESAGQIVDDLPRLISSGNWGASFHLSERESLSHVNGLSSFLEVFSPAHKRVSVLMDAMHTPRPPSSYIYFIPFTSGSSEELVHFIDILL